MTETLWTIADVTLNGTHQPRVEEVSLEIAHGVTAIIGYSGAGKTSLLNLLAGFEQPDSGQISFQHPEPVGEKFQLPLFWVPQDGGLWPHLTVGEHISSVAPSFDGRVAEKPHDSSDNLLERFGLEHRVSAVPEELSKGEQSRLAVARCLAARPAVMLMDEPLAHTDPVRRPKYQSLIGEYVKSTGASLIFTTHEPETAIREAASAVCMKGGRVIYSGPTSELYHKPPEEEVGRFLGPLNQFAPAERSHWLPDGPPDESGLVFLRPEAIELIPVENGPLEILSFEFSGSYAETIVQHVKTSQQKTIIHRPYGDVFRPGQYVRIVTRLVK